jgi:hypothetical protein
MVREDTFRDGDTLFVADLSRLLCLKQEGVDSQGCQIFLGT